MKLIMESWRNFAEKQKVENLLLEEEPIPKLKKTHPDANTYTSIDPSPSDSHQPKTFIDDSIEWLFTAMREHWNERVVDVLNGIESGYNDILGEKPEEGYFKTLKRDLKKYGINITNIYGKGGYVGGYNDDGTRSSNKGWKHYGLIVDNKYILVVYSAYSNKNHSSSGFRKYSTNMMTENIARILGNTVYKTTSKKIKSLGIPREREIGWFLGKMPNAFDENPDHTPIAKHNSKKMFYGASMPKPLFIFMSEILKGPLAPVVKANIIDYQSRWKAKKKGTCIKIITTNSGKKKKIRDKECQDSNDAYKAIMKSVSKKEEKLFWEALGLSKLIGGTKRGYRNRQSAEGYYRFLAFLFTLKNTELRRITKDL